MKSTIFKFFIVFLLIAGFAEAQIGVDKSLRRIGFHTGNRAAISFIMTDKSPVLTLVQISAVNGQGVQVRII